VPDLLRPSPTVQLGAGGDAPLRERAPQRPNPLARRETNRKYARRGDRLDLTALRELIISRPKPPLRARVVEFDGDKVSRAAEVLFDGVEGWYIDDGSRQELNLGTSAVTLSEDVLTAYSGHVHANAWVKPLFAGHLMTAFEAPPSQVPSRITGEVAGRDILLGRPCHIAELKGMKDLDDETVFRMWVDEAHGFVLRMQRAGSAMRLEVAELIVGSRVE
jgi:hypothetical protein